MRATLKKHGIENDNSSARAGVVVPTVLNLTTVETY